MKIKVVYIVNCIDRMVEVTAPSSGKAERHRKGPLSFSHTCKSNSIFKSKTYGIVKDG